MSRYNYFENLTVDGYAFPETPQCDFNFISDGMTFLNRDAAATFQYSFDGTTIHGDLVPSTPVAGVAFDNRVESKVWFRGLDGYGVVRVEAWGGWGRTQ